MTIPALVPLIETMIKRRIDFKLLRRQLRYAASATSTMTEALHFIDGVRISKKSQITERLSGYCHYSTLPTLTQIDTRCYNKFSRVYQMQIYTERISELLTHRNIEQLGLMLGREADLRDEELILQQEQERMDDMQRELDFEVGLLDNEPEESKD